MLSHCFLFGNKCLHIATSKDYGSYNLTKNGRRHKVEIFGKFLESTSS